MNYPYRAAKSILRHPLSFLKTLGQARRGHADVERWQAVDNLKGDWDSRTILIAGMIPAAAHVLEFGAGRLVLRDHLAPGCSYQPSDIVDRGDSTIVCDLNQGVPPLPRHYTHTVFSGVLEYIADLDVVIEALRSRTDTVIASYATTEGLNDYVTRRNSGWVNHLAHDEFIALFHRHGFRLTKTCSWTCQTIYVFDHVG